MKLSIAAVLFFLWAIPSQAKGVPFSKHLAAKFQVKACTTCHDFFEKDRGGLFFNSHEERTPETCVMCHERDVTGFKHEDDWFAMPGLYLSGMNAKETCKTMKKALHAQFKNDSLVARQIRKHLFEDPRVLWAIEGATPQSGKLPDEKEEKGLVKGGFTEWKAQVNAWIEGGMECE